MSDYIERKKNNPLFPLATQLIKTAKKHPVPLSSSEMPHKRHWVDLSSGTRLCFTLNVDSGEVAIWHLSLSNANGIVPQDEINACAEVFFDPENPIRTQRGSFNGGVIHLFQTAKLDH